MKYTAIIKHVEVRDNNNDKVMDIFTRGDRISKIKTKGKKGHLLLEDDAIKELIAQLPMDVLDLIEFYSNPDVIPC